jgi:hypothetical protein
MRRSELARIGQRGRPTTFLTLTVNPAKFTSPDERAQRLVSSWRLIRQTMRRRFGIKRVPFLAVFEETENGEPHLHILARMPYVAQRWLSRYMNKLMGAPIVDIQKVRSQNGVARYVSKYVSTAPRMWVGCKRYWTSRDWLFGEKARPEKQGPGCHYVERWQQKAQTVALTFMTLGYFAGFDGFRWLRSERNDTARTDARDRLIDRARSKRAANVPSSPPSPTTTRLSLGWKPVT